VGDASTWGSMLPTYESQAMVNNKLVYVEEWGVATSYKSNFDAQAAAINAQKYPWVYCFFISSQLVPIRRDNFYGVELTLRPYRSTGR